MYFTTSYLYTFDGKKLNIKMFKKTEKGRYFLVIDKKITYISRDDLAKLLRYKTTHHFAMVYAKFGLRMFIDRYVNIKKYYKPEPKSMPENRFITARISSTNFLYWFAHYTHLCNCVYNLYVHYISANLALDLSSFEIYQYLKL